MLVRQANFSAGIRAVARKPRLLGHRVRKNPNPAQPRGQRRKGITRRWNFSQLKSVAGQVRNDRGQWPASGLRQPSPAACSAILVREAFVFG
jgi:hypothetical protein